MNRFFLALAAFVVVVGVVGLVVLLISDGDTPAPTPAPSRAASEPGKPRLAPSPRQASSQPDQPEIDYTIGDHHIRDHRAGEQAPTEPPPPRRPPQGDREIATQVTQNLSQSLRPALQECAANLQPDAHGPRSRIEGEIRIAIKDHQATIASAAFQLRDVSDGVRDAIKRCLEQHAVGVVAPAADEADIDSYAITVSLRWP